MTKTDAMEALENAFEAFEEYGNQEALDDLREAIETIRQTLKSLEEERGVMAETIYRWQQTGGELHDKLKAAEVERDRLKADFAEACEVIKPFQFALKLHHQWQSSDETYGLELSPGQWIELNRGAEYTDSSMCEKTTDALRRASKYLERVKQ